MNAFRISWKTLPVVGMAAILVGIGAYTITSQAASRQQGHELQRSMAVATIFSSARFDLTLAELKGNEFLLSKDHEAFVEFDQSLTRALAGLAQIPAAGSRADQEFAASISQQYLPELEAARALFGALDRGETYTGRIPDAAAAAAVRDALETEADSKLADARAKGEAFETSQDMRSITMLGVDALGLALLLGFALVYRRLSAREARTADEKRRMESELLARSEARFRSLIQNLTDMIVITDSMARIVYMSPAVERVMGWGPDDLLGKVLLDYVHPGDVQGAWSGLSLVVHTEGRHDEPRFLRVRCKDGAFARLETHAINLLGDPDIKGIVFNVRDVTGAWEARAEQERLMSVIEATSDLIVITGLNGQILHLNRAAKATLRRWQTNDSDSMTFDAVVPAWLSARLKGPISTVRAQGSWRGELTFTVPDGSESVAEIELLGHVDAGTGEMTYISCVARDISERKRFQSQLVYMANHDALTGLHNRRRFAEEVERELGRVRRTNGGAAIIFLDLDAFKAINDSMGHGTGDELLCGVAQVIEGAAPSATSIARLGGDEFAVLVPDCDAQRATAIAEDVRVAVRGYARINGGQRVNTTASIGIALLPHHGNDVEMLLMNADLAMYEAKRNRDACRIYSPQSEYRAELTTRLAWEQRIRMALDEDLFQLAFQPICRTDGSIDAYEVLLRMRGDDGALIPPGEFLPVAERSGLIHLIDRWVISSALNLISREYERGFTLAVNISGWSLADVEFPQFVERELAASGVDPQRLILEITETAAIADITEAGRFIEPLARLGVRFAVDDFGAGFASFSYIKHLPVDHVKIDGAFIRNLPRDHDDQAFVRALVEVSHGLGKMVVAEFVEDAETMKLLDELGVDLLQGYYLGRPEGFEQALAGIHVLRGQPPATASEAA